MDKCVTGKIAFASAKDAKKVINHQKAARKRGHAPSRHYYTCEYCGEHHITSKSKSEVRRNKKKRDIKRDRIAFIAELKENNTVTWLAAHPVKWVALEILDENRAAAMYMVDGMDKQIMLRNE
jgi:hypothetical protein